LEAALWTEKYRPKRLDDIMDQEEIVSRLKDFVKRGTMPHCLFAGPQERARQLRGYVSRMIYSASDSKTRSRSSTRVMNEE